MNLVIRAQTLNDQPISQAIVGCFDLKGGTIGRSDTNTLALPDPERRISRLQAEVHGEDNGFTLRNVGTATAIIVNGRAVAPGESSTLADGDELRIGSYMLGVQVEVLNPVARTIIEGRAVVDSRAVIVASVVESRTHPPSGGGGQRGAAAALVAESNPFADLFGAPLAPAESSDPFAFLGAQSPAPAPDPPRPTIRLNTPMPGGAFSPSVVPSTPPALPPDFDPFYALDAPAPAPRPSIIAAPSGAADLLGMVGAGAGAASAATLDASFGLDGASALPGADPLAAFMAATAPMAPGNLLGAAPSNDPLAMFGVAAVAAPPGPAAFDHTPELNAAYRPPEMVAPIPAPPSPVPDPLSPLAVAAPVVDPFAGLDLAFGDPANRIAAPQDLPPPRASPVPVALRMSVPTLPVAAQPIPPMPLPTASATPATPPDALWAAFCEGTGVALPLPGGLDTDQMRMLGMIMREAVDGAVRLMALRALTKTELRASVTVIRPRNNNPLKFSPDLEVALAQILQPPVRGFMPGPMAMQDAMHDLVGHMIGTMAGMRAALAGVLARFEPAQLETKLAGKSMFDSLIPGARRAKLWDLYLHHFESIRGDAQDDFHTLFGDAFVAAYEEQLARMPRRDG